MVDCPCALLAPCVVCRRSGEHDGENHVPVACAPLRTRRSGYFFTVVEPKFLLGRTCGSAASVRKRRNLYSIGRRVITNVNVRVRLAMRQNGCQLWNRAICSMGAFQGGSAKFSVGFWMADLRRCERD